MTSTIADSAPTAEQVRERLHYDPETGIFMWRYSRVDMRGRQAGSLDVEGYRRISFNDRLYKAHRLAWLYMYGEWPKQEIDHINGVRSDNRIDNLRAADRFINTQNCAPRHRPGRLPGATLEKRTGLWKAQIRAGKVSHFLGAFETELEAHLAYMSAKQRLHVGFVKRSMPAPAAASTKESAS